MRAKKVFFCHQLMLQFHFLMKNFRVYVQVLITTPFEKKFSNATFKKEKNFENEISKIKMFYVHGTFGKCYCVDGVMSFFL